MKSFWTLLKFFLIFHFSLAFASAFDDKLCESQLNYFTESFAKNEIWALEMVDSWTKFQSGILQGNLHDVGNFDQCVNLKHSSGVQNVGDIQGKFCMIYYQAKANRTESEVPQINGFSLLNIGDFLRSTRLGLGGGFCLPSSCSPAKIQNFANNLLQNADLEVSKNYPQSDWCVTSDVEPLKAIDWVCIVICVILGCLLASSTIYEVVMNHRKQKPHELFSSFSIYKNGQKLFKIEDSSTNSKFLRCLPGIRTFAMMHILLGHRMGWTRASPAINAAKLAGSSEWMKTFVSAFIAVHPIAVDSFFVLGGMLLTRSMLSQIEKGKLNIFKLYLHRYLRTTPVLAFLILIILSIMRYFGDGPYWNFAMNGAFLSQCQDYWWTALIHIQNYYNPVEVCIQASWYLSADFQLVLISPILMYPIYKYGWKFLWILPTYVTCTEIWVLVISIQREYKAVRLLMPLDTAIRSAEIIYFPTHIRCGAWIVGVMLGYIFYSTKNRKIHINKYVNSSMWILFISTIISILIGLKALHDTENAKVLGNAFWLAFHRNSWAYAIGWVILACESGTGGVIKWFLELPIWQPFGRMSLSFYLVHTLNLTVFVGSYKTPVYFDYKYLIHSFVGDFMTSSFFAAILYLTFEEPILLIESYIYKQIEIKKAKSLTSI